MFGTLPPYMSLLCYANFDPLNILSSRPYIVHIINWVFQHKLLYQPRNSVREREMETESRKKPIRSKYIYCWEYRRRSGLAVFGTLQDSTWDIWTSRSADRRHRGWPMIGVAVSVYRWGRLSTLQTEYTSRYHDIRADGRDTHCAFIRINLISLYTL